MLPIPSPLRIEFDEYVRRRGISPALQGPFNKWLRFYLDFCRKYHFPEELKGSLAPFLRKLEEKRQTKLQQQQAAQAINLYYDLLQSKISQTSVSSGVSSVLPGAIPEEAPRQTPLIVQQAHAQQVTVNSEPITAGPTPTDPLPPLRDKELFQLFLAAEPSPPLLAHHVYFEPASEPGKPAVSPSTPTGASWREVFTRLAEEIELRHYSSKTLRNYRMWAQRFQTFTRSKDPNLLSSQDVKEFLTSLAVKEKVSASTQNQAFNGLLFFYRHVLQKEFGKVEGVVRAKRRPYIPVVLSREEIDAIIQRLSPPYDLVVKLLYGCGLRLFECLNLRVHCFNFDAGNVTVHDGKGQKDRTVPLPRKIFPELRAQIASLERLHQSDLDEDIAGVFMMNALDRKYRSAAKEFGWQWFFPAMELTLVPEAKELRRYHLHERNVSFRQPCVR